MRHVRLCKAMWAAPALEAEIEGAVAAMETDEGESASPKSSALVTSSAGGGPLAAVGGGFMARKRPAASSEWQQAMGKMLKPLSVSNARRDVAKSVRGFDGRVWQGGSTGAASDWTVAAAAAMLATDEDGAGGEQAPGLFGGDASKAGAAASSSSWKGMKPAAKRAELERRAEARAARAARAACAVASAKLQRDERKAKAKAARSKDERRRARGRERARAHAQLEAAGWRIVHSRKERGRCRYHPPPGDVAGTRHFTSHSEALAHMKQHSR
jgi:hypothetical protein